MCLSLSIFTYKQCSKL